MSAIRDYMMGDHRACDEAFADAEASVNTGDWSSAAERFAAFSAALERHLKMEEQVLFTALEARTGMSGGGPTQVMRLEHEQMRGVVGSMRESIDGRDANAFLGDAETLMVLTQQHNMKEEQILYPMCDQALADQAEELIGRMQAL